MDGETNNYNVGLRNVWSGKLGVGVFMLGGLLVAIYLGVVFNMFLLVFLSIGGYDEMLGLVLVTCVGETELLIKIIKFNLFIFNDFISYFYYVDVIEEIRKQ